MVWISTAQVNWIFNHSFSLGWSIINHHILDRDRDCQYCLHLSSKPDDSLTNNIDTGYTRGSDLDHLSINGTSNILETLRWSITFSNEWKGWWSKQRARGLSSEGTFYNSMKFDTDWTERDTCEWTKYVWIIVVTSMCSLSIESRIVSSW